MTVRNTSIAAYRDLDKSARRKAVMQKVSARPINGWTRQELAESLHWPINSVTGRVTELLAAGYLETAPFCRKNPFSGKNCSVVRMKQRREEVMA